MNKKTLNAQAEDKKAIDKRLIEVIKPLRTAKWQGDYSWDRIERALIDLGNDYEGLDMNPDFQRGHVWTPEQQVHFIENCLKGVVTSAGYLIQMNCPEWSYSTEQAKTDLPRGLQCIDGLQRYTAITEFVKGRIKPFGLSADDLIGTSFSHKRFYVKLAIHDFTRRADLLDYYLSINAGGTPHSKEELERVRQLLNEASNNKE